MHLCTFSLFIYSLHTHILHTLIYTHINSHYLISFFASLHTSVRHQSSCAPSRNDRTIYVLSYNAYICPHLYPLSQALRTDFNQLSQIRSNPLFFHCPFIYHHIRQKNEDFISEILTSYKRVCRVTLAVLFLHTSHTAFQAPQLNRAKAL